jgi:hypothetical protein
LPRMQLDVLEDGGMCTYAYKLRRLYSGGNNEVFAVRVARLDDQLMDVDGEKLVAYARSKARSGAAGSLSEESVAVLIHDLIAAKYDKLVAVDVAAGIYESRMFSGKYMHKLADTYDIGHKLVQCGLCDKKVAEYVDALTQDLFEGENTNVDVAGVEGLEGLEREECEWMNDVVVRIKKKEVDRGGEVKYWQAVEQTTRLSDAGLAPTTHARLLLARGTRVVPCVVMERFEYSLSEIQTCPALIRRTFVESDGEAVLVDLYTRTSRLMRCIDTKPDNVVVRLPKRCADADRSIQQKRPKFQDRGPRIALIDVDRGFCGVPPMSEGAAGEGGEGGEGVGDLEAALASFASNEKRGSPLLACALSLLVHCAIAAHVETLAYGFPYVAIARALLSQWHAIERLVLLDEADDETHAMVRGAGNKRVIEQLRRYMKILGTTGEVLERIREILKSALAESATNLLALCSGLGTTLGGISESPEISVDPVMYEYTALAMQQHDWAVQVARGARTLKQLQEGAEMHFEREITRPECMREMCELHGDLRLSDRPLIARRGKCTVVAREEAAHFGAQPWSAASMFI